jgi:TPR repeat protein
MYVEGDGVEQDYVEAHKWFNLAGKQRFQDARKRRKSLAKQMTSTQIAFAEMHARQWKQERRQQQSGD